MVRREPFRPPPSTCITRDVRAIIVVKLCAKVSRQTNVGVVSRERSVTQVVEGSPHPTSGRRPCPNTNDYFRFINGECK